MHSGRIVDPDPVFKPDPLNSLKIELFLQYLLFRKKRIKCEFSLGNQLVWIRILVFLGSDLDKMALLSGAIHEARTSKSPFLLLP